MKVHDKRIEESGRDPETGNYKEANALSLSKQRCAIVRQIQAAETRRIGERPGSRIIASIIGLKYRRPYPRPMQCEIYARTIATKTSTEFTSTKYSCKNSSDLK